MLLDPRNGPAFDLPPFRGPVRTWVIASTPRTGSTVLCRTIWDTGLVGAPKEYLNPMQVRDWEARLGTAPSRWLHRALRGPLVGLAGTGRWPDERLIAHLERVRACRTGPTGWFGLKLHHHHLDRWFLRRGRRPEAFLGAARWVWIRRRDRVAQAVSWARALQTGRWASHQRAWLPPVYDRRRIARCLGQIEEGEHGWQAWFAERGIAPLQIDYEDLAADLAGAVRRVLAGLDHRGPVRVPEPDLAPQADAINARWAERFRDEVRR